MLSINILLISEASPLTQVTIEMLENEKGVDVGPGSSCGVYFNGTVTYESISPQDCEVELHVDAGGWRAFVHPNQITFENKGTHRVDIGVGVHVPSGKTISLDKH